MSAWYSRHFTDCECLCTIRIGDAASKLLRRFFVLTLPVEAGLH